MADEPTTTDDTAAEGESHEDALAAAEDDAWAEVEREESGEPPDASDDESDDTADASADTADADGEAEAADPETSGEPAAEADQWAKAPAKLRAEYEALKAQADAAEHGRKSAEGRAHGLTRRLDAMMAGTADTPPANRTQSTENDPSGETTDEADPEWDAFQTDYPEIAKPVKTILDRFAARDRARIEALETTNRNLTAGMQTLGEDRLEAASEANEAVVKEKHPDYDDIQDSKEFETWYHNQPDYLKEGIKANAKFIVDPVVVDQVLTLYKQDTGIKSGDGGGSDAGRKSGTRKADPVRKLQRRSNLGLPRSSPGATLPEGQSTESEDDVWNEIERKERRKAA